MALVTQLKTVTKKFNNAKFKSGQYPRHTKQQQQLCLHRSADFVSVHCTDQNVCLTAGSMAENAEPTQHCKQTDLHCNHELPYNFFLKKTICLILKNVLLTSNIGTCGRRHDICNVGSAVSLLSCCNPN